MACVHDTALLIASLPGSPIVGMGSPFAFVKPGQEARHLCQGSLYIIDSEYQWHLLRPFLVGRDCPICKNWSTFPRRSRRPGCPGDQELGTRTHRRRRLTCRAATPCGSTLINCSFCLTSQAQWSAVSVKLLPCHRPPTCAQLVKGCPVCPASDRTPPLPSRPRTPWDQDDAPAGLGLAEASHAGTRRVSVRPPGCPRLRTSAPPRETGPGSPRRDWGSGAGRCPGRTARERRSRAGTRLCGRTRGAWRA